MQVVVIGEPGFRQDVSAALGVAPETVRWISSLDEVKAVEDLDLVILDPSIDDEDAVAYAESSNRTSPATALVVVRRSAPNGRIPIFIRAGFKDVVDLSLGDQELKDALHRAVDWSVSLRVTNSARESHPGVGGNVVTCFSSKGGTGKSFIACNLAAALADRSGRDTALVDLDLEMGDVFSYYGSEPARPIQDLLVVKELDDEQVRSAATGLGDHLFGFGGPPDPGAERIDSDALRGLLGQMRRSFDFVVIDAPADYSDPVLTAFDLSDCVYLIAGLDVVGIKHLAKGRETLLRIGVPQDRLRVVLNRADSKVGITPQDVERLLELEIDSMVPSSRLVPMSLNKGVPTYREEPRSEVSQAVGELADRLMASSGVTSSTSRGSGKRARHLLRRG